jgi:hypothetical protein
LARKSNDLPGVLTLLADRYQRRHSLVTRLKGLMVYPMIVLCSAFLLSCFSATCSALWSGEPGIITQHTSSAARTLCGCRRLF